MGDERYPLLCVDADYEGQPGGHSLLQPGETTDQPTTRCRQCMGSEALDTDNAVEWLLTMADEIADQGGLPVMAWSNWERPCVTAKPGAAEALREWADKFLNVQAWVCEGDE